MTKDFETECRQISQEHAHLYTLFGALECTVDRDAAVNAVADLERWLERHFAREEGEEGIFSRMKEDEADEVAALSGEHQAIQAILSETRRLLEASHEPGSEPVREATAILGASLRAHEKREDELIQRALARVD